MHSRRQLTFLLFFALASPTVLPSPDVGAAKKKAAKGKAPAKKGGKGAKAGTATPAPAPTPPSAAEPSTAAPVPPTTAPGTAAAPSAASPPALAPAAQAPAAAAPAVVSKGAAAPGPAAGKGTAVAAPATQPPGKGTALATPTPAGAAKSPPGPPAPAASPTAAPPETATASSPAPAPGDPGRDPAPTPAAEAGNTVEQRAQAIVDLARQGQRDQRAGRSEAAQAKLRQACEDAEREQLSGPLRAQIHLIYAWTLLAAGDSAGAQREGERAAELDPKDAEVQRDLAELQRENGQNEAAAASAQRALDLGLSRRDADEMRALAGRTEPSGFRARFRAEAGLSVGFDSNAAQDEDCQTIAGKWTCGAGKNQSARLASVRIFRALREDPVVGADVYRRAVAADYATAQPAQNQAAMPLELALGARYRVLGSAQTGLSVGYQFRQLFMVVAQGADNNLLPSAESYHLQRHTLTVSGQLHPKSWLDLAGRLDGFVTLSGLSAFTPFQGGLQATASGVVTESSRWATKADIVYYFRQSFDEANDGYLSGHRLRIRAGQELRLGWVRPMLSYRFTYDATGVLTAQAPLAIMYASSSQPTDPPQPANLGTYSYSAPLSYQGHQLSASVSLDLPLKIQAQAALRYEFMLYSGLYSATYTGLAVGAIPALPPFALPDVQRADHRVMLEAAAQKDLPYHLSLGLSYGLLANFSNVANALDNRSFNKHRVLASLSYYY